MQVICFATPRAEESAAPLVAAFRTRVPVDAVVTVVAGDQDRALWRSEFAGCEVVPDKPAGSKFAFVRELRRRRFDLALVAWTGGDRFRPMRLVALLAGARRVLVLDERGRWFAARGLWPWAMCRHALRRLAGTKADTCLRGLAAVYRWSVGLCLALPILAWRCLRLPPARPGPRA
jgi:hypothetical protein